MFKTLLFVITLGWPVFLWAESDIAQKDNEKEITMTTLEAIKLAGNLVEHGDLKHAEQMLTMLPEMHNGALEIERWFLLGQIAQKRNDFEKAIKIYRQILDAQPDLARIRFELALCYMKTEKWYRADYHLRLAMSGKDLPDNIKQIMNYYRYIIRQNKRWNIWFNFGAAPDNNINNGNGGQECVIEGNEYFCRDLKTPESVVGGNLTLGGNYEFVLSDHWRWKSDANIYSNVYNKHVYDDLYLSTSTGPRYIWDKGDIWFSVVGYRRWYGWEKYNWSYGGKIETNYDFTRKLSSGLTLQVIDNKYDEYGPFLNGQTYSGNMRIIYSLNARLYAILYTGLSRENTIDSVYSYWQPSIGMGVGIELPLGFHIYTNPSFYWSDYDDAQWVVKDNQFTQVTEHDFVQRYAISISNNKFDVWGFVPTLTVSYTRRDSNIWQKEYDKYTAEFTMQQRF